MWARPGKIRVSGSKQNARSPMAAYAGATSYVGTIDSSVGNPFSFKVKKSDNLGMAAAIVNFGWILTWTDPRFDNGGFNASQINVRTQSGSGFASIASQDATFYNFAGWFGAAQIPQGTQFTINWTPNANCNCNCANCNCM